MTPVTVFRGKTVAVFGLGASGLATCVALAAGGARVVAWDDQAAKITEAKAKGFAPEDLRALTRDFYARFYHVTLSDAQIDRVLAGRD